jgi:Fur family transcriptional regulator, ferric uptake regulator
MAPDKTQNTKSICNRVAFVIASDTGPLGTNAMKASTQLLKSNGLKRTAAREAILKLLADAERPLSHHDILNNKSSKVHLDRVTVYRTLETLQNKGLLHRIQGMDGTWRFCRHRSEAPGECAGNHIHFLCSKCDQMSCLPEQPLPWIETPAGAIVHSKQLVVHGHCAACVAREKSGEKNR